LIRFRLQPPPSAAAFQATAASSRVYIHIHESLNMKVVRIVAIFFCCCAAAKAQHVAVKLAEGPIIGYISYSNTSSVGHVPLATFLGVPYGESTGGDSRWNPPRPKSSWSETRDATKFAAACPGGTMTGNLSDPKVFSEDCLFANIWTPASALHASEASLPVVVWIHGGGFFLGTANDPVWWGHQWAARGVVLVTFEYRLGALGFFHSSAERNATNFGLLDQLLLLRWVQRNAAAFGGDRSRVTVGSCSLPF
jgi:para-nitrobenzyl esterase